LAQFRAVALLGPRRVGKTTITKAVATSHAGAVVLGLERESARAALAQTELFLPRNRDRLVVLDEVQHVSALFAQLRPEIEPACSVQRP
jgi:predicted AAA+ superfamily ATPase